MELTILDWTVIIAFFGLILSVGLSYTKQAGKDVESFFLGGRNIPWYLLGISMVATTFAADTPLAVTELVGAGGISGNWLWWNALIGGMLTTFFFARLWRKSGVVTEAEICELRYGGKLGELLRGFKAVYLGVFLNVIIIAWVNVALITLLQVFFGMSDDLALMYVAGGMVLVAIYAGLSGLIGVVMTDVIQFIVAMTGCILLAVIVVNSEKIGGIDGLKDSLEGISPSILDFFPVVSNDPGTLSKTLTINFFSFFGFVAIQWWAAWMPGAEPGGGGYIAQRMMSARTEKDAVYSTLFFQVAHYCIRPWPWILVGLCALVLYPELSEKDLKLGYVYAMRDYLDPGFKGLLLAAFFAAYMSTISTQLNWGASYLVNDVYGRFINKDADNKNLVLASRVATVILMVIGLLVTTQVETIAGAWKFLLQCGAGLGLVLILRWYWWRVSAWSEIAAMIAPLIPTTIFFVLTNYNGQSFEEGVPFLITVLFTTIVWLTVTFLTPPSDDNTLQHFYNKIQPDGVWGIYEQNYEEEQNQPSAIEQQDEKNRPAQAPTKSKRNLLYLFLCWFFGLLMTYGLLFFIGKFIFKEWIEAGGLLALVIASFFALQYFLKRTRIFED